MPPLNREEWEALSPYLDQVLTMPGDQRDQWLASLEDQNRDLAARLKTLLREHDAAARERFLDQSPIILPRQDAVTGQTVGQYTLVSCIGKGGMGSVWLAQRNDGRFERRAAVKFLDVALAGRGEERFRREGSILGRLTHPNIAQLSDAGVSQTGQPYLVLEYVDGRHIDEYCDDHKLDVEARIRLFLEVLGAVAYAHANLIVHRDLKPSNVLVATDGHVKLLDFGIAKLLREEGGATGATELTRESGAALTPYYAAPEQLADQPITTATDVYALGVLLHQILTGAHPAGRDPLPPAELMKAIMEREPPRPSDAVIAYNADASAASALAANRATTPEKLARFLRGDLDTIIAKALKKNPQERYGSAIAMTDDLQRYLNHEPIKARPDAPAYRAAKFLRRNRLAVAAVGITIAALTIGLYVANHERAAAQHRFLQVRQLANEFIELDADIRGLPGATSARKKIVAESIQYLTALGTEAPADPDLALEIGNAYLQVARVQGVPVFAHLGQFDDADMSLRRADALVKSVLAREPRNRHALLTSAEIAHDWMTLVDYQNRRDEAMKLAHSAADQLDRFVALGNLSPEDIDEATHIYSNLGVAYENSNHFEDAIRTARRAIEISQGVPAAQMRRGAALGVLAISLRYTGDLEGALQASTESLGIIEKSTAGSVGSRLSNMIHALQRQGQILGEDNDLTLKRSADARAAFQKALDIAEDQARQDPNDNRSRYEIAITGCELADILRHSDPGKALTLYDHALATARESKVNARILIAEVSLLAGSSYAARWLHRETDARSRIQGAYELLSKIGEYPSDKIEPGEEVYTALRARSDDFAEAGEPEKALAIYEELLPKMMAWGANPRTNLRDGEVLSNTWLTMARLCRRVKRPEQAAIFESRNRELWNELDRKVPNDPYILRKIALSVKE